MTRAVLQLEPLTCPSCIKKIEGALAKTQGIKEAKVLFNLGKVKVQFEESALNLTDIVRIVERLGYQVLSQRQAS